MNLKNYTTKIPAYQSVNQIKKMLIDYGANGIMEEYGDNKKISGICFILDVDGFKLPFKLPAKEDGIYRWLLKKHKNKSEDDLRKQAERVCWKQMYEWVHIQLSLVELDQAAPLEVFFPYLYDRSKNESYYQKAVSNGIQKLLPTT